MLFSVDQDNSPGGWMRSLIRPPLPEFLLFLLALCVRLVGIQSRPLWYDEAFAVLFAQKGVAAMLQGTISPAGGSATAAGAAADVHPLLYYSLLNLWMQIFGSTPAAVRWLSILFGLGSVILLYILGSALFDRRAGLLAALFASLSPFQVHYSQEVRMYALLTVLVIGAALALRQAIRTSKLHWWVLFSLLAALAQYSHHLAAIHLLALAATALASKKKSNIARVLFAGLGALVLYLPWLIQVPAQFARVSSAYWTEKPGADRLITALLSYVTSLPLSGIWLPAGLFITIMIFILAVWQTLRALIEDPKDPVTWQGLWLGWIACAPVALLFILSQWRPIFIERALLPSGAFFLAWLVWVLAYTKIPAPVRWMAGTALIFGMTIGLFSHWQYRGFPYADFSKAGYSLQDRYQNRDLVLHSNKLTAIPMIYYVPGLPQSYLPDPPGSGSDTLAPATQRVLGLLAEVDLETATDGSERVWFIIFHQAVEEYRRAGYDTHPHLDWLNQRYHLEQSETYNDLQIYLYER